MSPPPLDVERVLPHRGPARLVGPPLRREGTALVCRGRVPASSPWARAGRAPAALGLEMGAQAAALAGALEGDPAPEGPRVGFVVGVRGARFARPELPVETALDVRVERVGGAGELAVYALRVLEGAREIVSGRVSVFVTSETL